jgi:DNA-binding CsgD family transcriptional regulator
LATFLNISVKTVEKHRATIMGKLYLLNAPALTAYAIVISQLLNGCNGRAAE